MHGNLTKEKIIFYFSISKGQISDPNLNGGLWHEPCLIGLQVQFGILDSDDIRVCVELKQLSSRIMESGTIESIRNIENKNPLACVGGNIKGKRRPNPIRWR